MNREQLLAQPITGAVAALNNTHSPSAIQRIATGLAHEAFVRGQSHAIAALRTIPEAALILDVTTGRVRQLARQHGLGWRPDARTLLLRDDDIAILRARTRSKS